MGGEPTFVSIDDFEAEEWNTAAVGPTKRALADQLIRRLRDRFAPGGFLHYGQGKWYPGETPAALDLLALLAPRRRADLAGRPPRRRGGRRHRGRPRRGRGAAAAHRRASSASRPQMVTPAYEDPAEWMLKESDLPVNVTPEDSEAQGPRGAPPHRPRLRPRPDHALGLHPAGPGLAVPGHRPPLALGEVEARAAAFSTSCPATARSASACRCGKLPARLRRRTTPTPTSSTRPCRAARSPTSAIAPRAGRPSRRSRSRQPRPADGALHRRRHAASRTRSSRSSARPAAPSAPRSRSSPATAGSASSCRRSRASRTISTCSPPPRPPRRRWACRSTSRATPRRPTRG